MEAVIMADNAYEAVMQAIEKLSPADRLRLVTELTGNIPQHTGKLRRPSILELRGLGKGVWAGVHPDEYVDLERTAWDG
ncbi:MAG: hypothetical protein HYR60_00720 [Acidobacteria bacterium]|nr:hypothetical protein [Acidobacteriota bacterium]